MEAAQALLELQNLDLSILMNKKKLDELPEKRAILEVRAKQREVEQLKAQTVAIVARHKAELKAKQDEMTLLGEKIAGEQTKIMQTADHRQIQALTREMDGLKRRSDKLEMESLQVLEKIEKAEGQVAKVDDALASLANKEKALIARYQAVGGELQSQIKDLEDRRAADAAIVPADLLSRYESIREAKGGIGVGRLEGETCTACRMSLPAERVRELQGGDDVGICPTCRRLIIVRGAQ